MKKKTKEFVFDNIDSFLKLGVDLINTRYQISKKVSDFKAEVITLMYSLKKNIIKTLIELIFITSAIISLILGLIMFLERFYPKDYILLVYGFAVLVLMMFTIKLKK